MVNMKNIYFHKHVSWIFIVKYCDKLTSDIKGIAYIVD